MIWLTWRQFRVQALVVGIALAAAAAVLAITGPHLADLYRTSETNFFSRLAADGIRNALYYVGLAVGYAVPAVVGAFWGAPLIARELESGTHRLVWNQSISRQRWLATKLGLAGLAAAATGLIGLVVTWWCGPIDKAVNHGYSDPGLLSVPRLWPEVFGARGVVPIGYVVLAFAIGVTAGLVIRRTVPAMAVTLVAVVAVQIFVPVVVQPRLLTPRYVTTTITATNLNELQIAGPVGSDTVRITQIGVSIDKPGAWLTSNQTLDGTGRVVHGLPSWATDCAPPPPGQKATTGTPEQCFAKLAEAGYRQRVAYLPASRYWTLQWIETAILLGLALLLIGFNFWWNPPPRLTAGGSPQLIPWVRLVRWAPSTRQATGANIVRSTPPGGPPARTSTGIHRARTHRRRLLPRTAVRLGLVAALIGTMATSAAVSYAAYGPSADADQAVRPNCESGSCGEGTPSARPRARVPAGSPAAGSAPPARKRPARQNAVFAPYVDVLQYPLPDLAATARTAGIKHLNLAFIVAGDGCTATWGGSLALRDQGVANRVAAFRAAGGKIRISFGGQSGTELAAACDSADELAAQYQSVISAYSATRVDFDIEGAVLSDTETNDRRAKAIKILERTASSEGKSLDVSVTLPVSPQGLTQDGVDLLANATDNGATINAVNVMAMDYGDQDAPNPDGQMGRYAISAMTGTQAQIKRLFGLSDGAAWRRVAVTALIGVNEPATEVFTPSDARQVAVFARLKGIAFVSMWSIARDRPCPDGVTANATADTCSGAGRQAYEFTRAFSG